MVNGSLVAIHHLRDHGGVIVNLARSDSPSPILSAYSANKATVALYTRALQEELGIDGLPIAVTLARPSGDNTPLAEHAAVCLDGGARLPPYPYDPEVVARAIVDALEHDRGEMIVGGCRRLIVPLSQLFPGATESAGQAARPRVRRPLEAARLRQQPVPTARRGGRTGQRAASPHDQRHYRSRAPSMVK